MIELVLRWFLLASLSWVLQEPSWSEAELTRNGAMDSCARCPLQLVWQRRLWKWVFPQQPERLGVLPIKLRGGLGQPPETLHQVPRGSEGMEPVPKWRFHSWNVRFREVPKSRFHSWNVRFWEVPKWRFHSWNVRFREVPKWRFRSWNVRFREVPKWRFHSWNVRFREVPKSRFHSWNVRFREVPKSRFHSWNVRFWEVPKWRFHSWNVRFREVPKCVRFREVPKWRFHLWNVRFREVPKWRFHSWNVRFREVPKWRFRSWNVRFREVPKWRFHSWNVRFREVPKSRFHSWNVRSFFEIWYVFAYNMFCVSHSMFFVSHSMFSAVPHNMSKRKRVPVHQLLGFSHGLIFFKMYYSFKSILFKHPCYVRVSQAQNVTCVRRVCQSRELRCHQVQVRPRRHGFRSSNVGIHVGSFKQISLRRW